MENLDTETPKSPTEEPPPQQQEPDPKRLKMSTTTTDDDEVTSNTENTNNNNKKPRYKRRKIAIFFAYCGVGYQGMQKNPGAKTIEGDLEEALFHAGGVPDHDRGNPKRYDWARSARTDKGVSAVGQVVSGRFYVDPPGFVERLNSILPGQIRIFGYKRVTSSFSAKKFCDRRRYVYLIPVFALDPSSHRDRESVKASLGSGGELVKCLECSDRGRKVIGIMGKRIYQLGLPSNSDDSNPNSVAKEDGNGDNINLEEDKTVSESIKKENRNSVIMEEETTSGTMEEIRDSVANGSSVDNECTESIKEDKTVSELITEDNTNSEIIEEETTNSETKKENRDLFANGISVENDNTNLIAKLAKEEEKTNGEDKWLKGSGFSYNEEVKERFNRVLKYYVGSHNFHNFTTRTKAEDPSAQRYIISFHANTVVNVEGVDFVKCEVVGQSFMLHQIRKMIGLSVAIMRNCAPESLIETALRKDVNINVPTAPEVGLYLDECFFTSYNQKWKDSHEELSMKAYKEEAEEFKMKHIYSHIGRTENKEGVVALWLHSLNHRNYPDLLFNNTSDTTEAKTHPAEEQMAE